MEEKENSSNVIYIIGAIIFVILILSFGYIFGTYFSESNNNSNDIYYLEGEYYSHFGIITKDGRIWSSDFEVDQFHHYLVTIDGRNTKDTSDDVLINISTVFD